MEQLYYDIPNILADEREKRAACACTWRASVRGCTKFAAESFPDEIRATGKDPLALRLELAKDEPRVTAVLRAAAEMAQWSNPRPKRPRARHRVRRLPRHADCALPKSQSSARPAAFACTATGSRRRPDRAAEELDAQSESAVVYGLSAALTEESTVKEVGAIRETNFHQYRVLRMADMPEIHTKLVVTDNSPTGMGRWACPRSHRQSPTPFSS